MSFNMMGRRASFASVLALPIGLMVTWHLCAGGASMSTAQLAARDQILPMKPTDPQDNPTTPAKVELGRQLFFDPRLSKDGTVSCNSCHNVMSYGTDNRPVSVGINGQKGGRSAPTVMNSGFLSVQFWDGRAASLEDQAKGPLTNPIEMGMSSHDEVMQRVKKMDAYVKQFQKVFPAGEPVTIDNLAKAIAAFERTLVTQGSSFDRWARGDASAMSAKAQRGYAHFQELGCKGCHSGPNFSGPALPVGTGFYQKFPTFAENDYVKKYKFLADDGRKSVTKLDEDAHMFRVPTLRNVAMTAPYFHNGNVESLKEAIAVMGKTQLNRDLNVLQIDEIYEFLVSLTGNVPEQKMPRIAGTAGMTLTP